MGGDGQLVLEGLLFYSETDEFVLVHVKLVAIVAPYPDVFLDIEGGAFEEVGARDENLVKEVGANVDAMLRRGRDAASHDFALERAKDDQSEFDCHTTAYISQPSQHRMGGGSGTIDMRRSTSMANHALRDLEDVEETDTQAQIVDYLFPSALLPSLPPHE